MCAMIMQEMFLRTSLFFVLASLMRALLNDQERRAQLDHELVLANKK